MAFEPKRDKMEKALNESLKKPVRKRKVGRPSGKTKKPWTFTLKPENRDKLDLIAAKEGFNGAATFLDYWIEHYNLDE